MMDSFTATKENLKSKLSILQLLFIHFQPVLIHSLGSVADFYLRQTQNFCLNLTSHCMGSLTRPPGAEPIDLMKTQDNKISSSSILIVP